MFAFASWFAPSIVLALGPRISMILAALLYLFNIVQLLYLEPVSIYIASALLGLGAPIIWTAQVDVIFGKISFWGLWDLVRWDRWDARRPMFPTIPPSPPHPTSMGLFLTLMFENLKEVCL